MYSMKKGGSSKSSKQQAAIAMAMKAAGKKPKMAMGGSAKSSLAAKYGDPNKITRGDIITAAKQNAGKMKMGGSCGTPKRLKK